MGIMSENHESTDVSQHLAGGGAAASRSMIVTRVNLDAIVHNTRVVKDLVGPDVQLRAIVKADGYHHGVGPTAHAMLEGGADALGVATLPEALELRELGIEAPVLAWMWTPDTDLGEVAARKIQIAVTSQAHAEAVRTFVDNSQVAEPVEVYIMVETGMHRNGVEAGEFENVAETLRAEGITVRGLMSHLACADDPDNPETTRQGQRFQEFIDRGRAKGLELKENHLCNSPGTLTRPDLHHEMVRPGVALYGLEPIPGKDHGLRPAMQWEAPVLRVKPITQGEGTSYGLTWQAPEDGYLAVVPMGYADGVSRSWQGHLEVTVNGHRYPQVGRVCMDQFLIFLGSNPHAVQPGDTAVVFGPGDKGEMTATELATATGTINYEIVCSPQGRTAIEYEHCRRTETMEDTQELAAELAAQVRAGDVVILDGPLGAGKTTFTQGFARGLGPNGVTGKVTSPTFVIAREHPTAGGGPNLVHVDAYRLLGEDPSQADPLGELDALDLDTALDDAVVVAEWGGGLVEQLEDRYLLVRFDRESAATQDPDSEARFISWEWVQR